MGLDSYLPLKKSGQSVIDRNLPYRFLSGQPLKCQDLKFNRAKLVLCYPLNSRTITIAALCLSYWRGNCDCLCK